LLQKFDFMTSSLSPQSVWQKGNKRETIHQFYIAKKVVNLLLA